MRSGSAWAFPPSRPPGHDLTDVPPDLDQTYSAVTWRSDELLQSAAAVRPYPANWDATPKETLAEFFRREPR